MESELFEVALGMKLPLYVDVIVFDAATGELHTHMDFEKGGKFSCTKCGKEELPVYDTEEKT